MGRSEPQIDPRQNVIIGLGPAGLAAAIECCRSDSKHRKVVAFHNRSDYTRREVVRIQNNLKPYFQSLVGADVFQELILKDKILFDFESGQRFFHVQIKELESLLRAVLDKYAEAGAVEIIDVGAGSFESIQHIDKLQHVITLGSGRQIPFANIVEADGGKHGFASQLSDEHMSIEYFPLQQEQFCVTHAVANFKIPSVPSQ